MCSPGRLPNVRSSHHAQTGITIWAREKILPHHLEIPGNVSQDNITVPFRLTFIIPPLPVTVISFGLGMIDFFVLQHWWCGGGVLDEYHEKKLSRKLSGMFQLVEDV